MSIDRPHLKEPAILPTTAREGADALSEAPSEQGQSGPGAFHDCLADLGAAGAPTGAVRLEKVAQVRAALSAGTYSVPTEAVALKMLDAMLALEQKRVLEDRRQRPRVGHRSLLRGRTRRDNY